MTAYVIAEIEITDPVVYEDYRARVEASKRKIPGQISCTRRQTGMARRRLVAQAHRHCSISDNGSCAQVVSLPRLCTAYRAAQKGFPLQNDHGGRRVRKTVLRTIR